LAGWKIKVSVRASGKTQGRIDYYYISPLGKRLRSLVEVKKELTQMSNPEIDPDKLLQLIKSSRTK